MRVFLVQSVGAEVFQKLAKEGVKVHDFDCRTQVTTYFACKSKENAVDDCRKYNRVKSKTIFFVNIIYLYS